MEEKYIQIGKKDVPAIFEIIENKVYLRNSRATPIRANFPFPLNEDIARLAAMVLDGSLSKDLRSCIFAQKKDIKKIKEIRAITETYFGVKGSIRIDRKTGTHIISYPMTFTSFLHHCIGIYKSDMFAGIPHWLWRSPPNVVKDYLRYAFAMEGSVRNPKKGKEIRFHSCDLPYLKELKILLSDKYGINSKIYRYHIKNYGWKYYLHFEKEADIRQFYNSIGFALNSHQERLKINVESIKAKAWEITLVKLSYLPPHFESKDVSFPYLSYRAINHRLTDLTNKGYLTRSGYTYTLTESGITKAISLKESVRIVPLRTKSQDNELNILNFLREKKVSYNGEIARKLSINSTTIRGVLRRLQKRQKIRMVFSDKFQRRFYEPVEEKNIGGNPPSSL